MLKFPYGLCDFYALITEGYVYVDRTGYIPLVEEAGRHLLFLRPRRFGKSLWLSTLENYYDVAKADQFERLFGHLAVGQAPTLRHNRYFVMKWDFSMVDPQGEPEDVKRSLHWHINARIEAFSQYYQDFLSYPITINPLDAGISLESVLTAISKTPYPLYLLIDEYDNFANEVLMSARPGGQQRYEALLYGEGAMKSLFKVVKGGSAGRGLERVFITGVSPVAMSDITSSYNIAENLYLRPPFNALCGFTEAEVWQLLFEVAGECGYAEAQAEAALTLMRTYYNGYRFNYDVTERVYNPTLAFYFLKSFQAECGYPREMLDSNLAMDRNRLGYVARLPGGPQVIATALDPQTPLAIGRLADRFGVGDILYAPKGETFSVSLLYYLGALTLQQGATPMGELIFHIPNLVIRELYVERMRELLLPDLSVDAMREVQRIFYTTGDIQPLCDFVVQHYFKVLDNRDYRWANEFAVKLAFLTLLFNNIFYIVDSETALAREYADLTMIIRPDMRQYQLLDFLIEFKYVGLTDVALTGAEVRAASAADLAALPPVQAKLAEARAKLPGYRQALETAHHGDLRLHTYAVVAIGFERLVWEEV